MKEITVEEFIALQNSGEDIQVIDVREPFEYAESNINGILIPLGEVEQNTEKISHDKKVIVHCKMGSRSARAIEYLEQAHGFDNLYNLRGGIVTYLQVKG